MLHRHPISHLFFFNDTATTEIYTLSLHDALPISLQLGRQARFMARTMAERILISRCSLRSNPQGQRSEEHTSELQSHLKLVCRLLLQKKKKEFRFAQQTQATIATGARPSPSGCRL